MHMIYGYDLKDKNDEFLQLIYKAVGNMGTAMGPIGQLFDAYPIRESSFYWSWWNDESNDVSVRSISAWVPGTAFNKFVLDSRLALAEMQATFIKFVRANMVGDQTDSD